MPAININTDASVIYAAKLERIGRAALPVAVRQTLNRAAMDVKRITMPAETDRDFIKRKPTFFSATSRVEFAKGLDVNRMQSIVGFVAPAGAKESGHATKDLEEQEHGGAIDKRAFIATDGGRSNKGNVKQALTMASIKNYIVDASKEMGKNSGEKFIRAAIKVGYGGGGAGGFVIGTGTNGRGNKALLQIISIHRLKRGENKPGYKTGDMVIKTKEVYSVRAKRRAHVKATHFMQKASEASAAKMEQIFKEQAEIAINRV